ncbi:MAG: chemotaxis protein CheW [Myxococcota bacterium]
MDDPAEEVDGAGTRLSDPEITCAGALNDEDSPDVASLVASLPPTALGPTRQDEREATYGSFGIGESEFILPASDVREVVPFPDRWIGIPLAPNYLIGMFDLRGEVVPMVCVGTLLGLPTPPRELGTARVAIVDCGDEQIGAVFCRTGDVVRVQQADLQPIHHAPGEKNPVVNALLSLDGGARILQCLSAELIAQVESIPRANRAAEFEEENESPKLRFVAVQVGELQLALEGSSVIEIQERMEVQPSTAYFDHSAGLVDLRGELIPVLHLDAALGHASTAEQTAQRLVFVHDERTMCALLVDAVLDVFEVEETAVQQMPMLGRLTTGAVCDSVVSRGPDANFIVLDTAALFRTVHLDGAIMENRGALERLSSSTEQTHQELHEQSFLVFSLGSEHFGLPLSSIREIQNFPEEYIRPPGGDDRFVGMMNLRGTILSLVDLRSHYQLESDSELEATKVLIVEAGDTIGFLVDGLVGIVHTDDESRLELPTLARTAATTFHDHADCIVKHGEDSIVALNPMRLVAAA